MAFVLKRTFNCDCFGLTLLVRFVSLRQGRVRHLVLKLGGMKMDARHIVHSWKACLRLSNRVD